MLLTALATQRTTLRPLPLLKRGRKKEKRKKVAQKREILASNFEENWKVKERGRNGSERRRGGFLG